jgi:hypothetical protein
MCEAAIQEGFGPDQIGICLDTAHLNAGKIKLKTREDARLYIEQLKYPDYIALLHLNGNEYDSEKRAGDKHCIPLSKNDYVFRDTDLENSGAAELSKWFVDRDCDVILEQDWNDELQTFYHGITDEIFGNRKN